jgi:hypothetical protein
MTMPKRPTAAQRARERQRETGENYTTALRRPPRSDRVLYAAVKAAGLRAETASLENLYAAQRRQAPYLDRAAHLDAMIYEQQNRLPKRDLDMLEALARQNWVEGGAYDEDPFVDGRVVLYAAFGALAHVARTGQGRPLAAAAAAVLGDDDPYLLSDYVRCCGRQPRQSCACAALSRVVLAGPDVEMARDARAAADALARAARVPSTGNDEDWTEAAELIEEALAHASRAAAVPDGM